jgi:acyl-ACP thioesterase
MSKDVELVRVIDTNYSDVDINGHINSVKYIEHVLDLFDVDFYKQYRLKRFEIAYVAESHQGDKLCFYREQVGDNEYNIRINKRSSNEQNEVEVVRSSVKFVKD